MRVRAARVAKFVNGHSRYLTPFSNPLIISDSPSAAENPAASSSVSDRYIRATSPNLPSETLPLPKSASTPAPPLTSSNLQTQISDSASALDFSAFATTGNEPINLETKAEVRVRNGRWLRLALRRRNCLISSLHCTTWRLICFRNLDVHRSLRRHWSPLPPPVPTQQTALGQTHISPMSDAVAIVVKTNSYTFKNNGVPIDFVQLIVVVEKRRILLNMRVDVLAPSVLLTPIKDRSTRGDIYRPLQTYANIVAIFSKRLKTQFCVFYDCVYTLDALRFTLPRERTVYLGQYVLLKNDALRENGTAWSRSRAYRALFEDLWRPILKRVVQSDFVENAHGLLELFNGVV